jgi:hypothetical protein
MLRRGFRSPRCGAMATAVLKSFGAIIAALILVPQARADPTANNTESYLECISRSGITVTDDISNVINVGWAVNKALKSGGSPNTVLYNLENRGGLPAPAATAVVNCAPVLGP